MLSKVFLVFGMILSLSSININDYRRYDDLSVYRERLEEFNETHNTNYIIPDEPLEGNHESQIEFLTSMTLKEFDEYILSLYQLDLANPDPNEKYAATESQSHTHNNSFKYQSQISKSDFIMDMIRNIPVKDGVSYSAVYLD